MQFSLQIGQMGPMVQLGLFALVANTMFLALVYLAQYTDKDLPPRGRKMPKTNQKFRYAQDFLTTKWGNSIGMPLVLTAFFYLIQTNANNMFLGVVVFIASVLIFLKVCLLGKRHTPNYAFPYPGVISIAGMVRVCYFGASVSASMICVLNICVGDLSGPLMWTGLAGGAFCLACFLGDIGLGNYTRIKDIEQETPKENVVGFRIFRDAEVEEKIPA